MSPLRKFVDNLVKRTSVQPPYQEADNLSGKSSQPHTATHASDITGQSVDEPRTVGHRIAGRYEIIKILSGGMGYVYLCLDTLDDRPVALKTLKPEFLPDREAREQFLNEGAIWVKLGSHPHVVEAYGVEIVEGKREVYLILEWITQAEGRQDASLRSWLIPGHSLPLEQSLLFALHIVRGMRHATSKLPGLVHRDLKPENVLIGSDGNLRVTDFGLAKLAANSKALKANSGDTDLGQTQTTSWDVCGTPLYMAPEQWRQGHPLDTRADIYAFGCILFEMVTGMQPVLGSDLESVRSAHCSGKIRPIPPALPQTLQDLLRICLSLRPNDRYSSWAEIEAAIIEAYASAVGKQAPVVKTQLKHDAQRTDVGWAWHNLGFAHLELGKPEIALSYMNRALQIAETNTDCPLMVGALNGLALAHLRSGDTKRAVDIFDSLDVRIDGIDDSAALFNTPPILMSFGATLRAIGEEQRAIPVFERALTLSRRRGDVRVEAGALNSLGNAHRSLGEYDESISLFQESLALFQMLKDRANEGLVQNNLGIVYRRLNDPERAIIFYKQALAIAEEIGDLPLRGKALGNLGNAFADTKQYTNAIPVQEEALAIARETGDRRAESLAHRNLGKSHDSLTNYHEAIHHFRQALVVSESISDQVGADDAVQGMGGAYYNLGIALARLKRTPEAMAALKEALKMIPHQASEINKTLVSVHNQTAHDFAQRGLIDESIAELRSGLKIDPHNTNLQLYLAFVCVGSSRWQQGIVECQAALRLDPHNQMALTLLGDAYSGQGQLDLAIQYYQQTIRINPNYGAAHSGLAVVYARQGRVVEAKREVQVALRSGYQPPEDLLAWLRNR
jgi:serine/threonine protein kinase/Tfp pilus assembly protein PilF